MQTNFLKIFSAFVPLGSITIDILGPLARSWRHFQYIIVVADRFTKLLKVVLLRHICSVYVDEAILGTLGL